MGEQRHNREPKLARTDFESMTHEQLAALLASANTAGASHLFSKLSKAASTITKIGDDLMTYVKGLEWQGEGGDAFRDWGGQTASSTLRLGQYAEVAARWMGTVSQAIAEAKAAMPDVSETTRAKTDLADAHKTITAANQPGGHNDPRRPETGGHREDGRRSRRTPHGSGPGRGHPTVAETGADVRVLGTAGEQRATAYVLAAGGKCGVARLVGRRGKRIPARRQSACERRSGGFRGLRKSCERSDNARGNHWYLALGSRAIRIRCGHPTQLWPGAHCA
ncbi:hypothetical protein AB7952_05690 [Streptomyces sp. PG2]